MSSKTIALALFAATVVVTHSSAFNLACKKA